MPLKSYPFADPADGPIVLPLGIDLSLHRHQVGLKIYQADGTPAASATGTVSSRFKPAVGDQFTAGASTLNLAVGDRSFAPEEGAVIEFELTVSGLNPGYLVEPFIDSWEA